MKYLFGPVPSRRLGLSLGIDLMPHKTCSLDCLYCECGETTDFRSEPGELFPVDEIIAELDSYLSSSPDLDYCTFSGSGEPTLHSGLGKIISFLRNSYPHYKIAVLTNGTLLHNPSVRVMIMDAHLVSPSLDALSEDVFSKMLRPAPGITAELTVQGIKDFAREYKGKLSVEVFILPGYNDSKEELAKIRQVLVDISPTVVELNSLHRPGTVSGLKKPGIHEMEEIRDFFEPLPVSLVSRGQSPGGSSGKSISSGEVMSTLKRRPQTLVDLEKGLNVRRSLVLSLLGELMKEGVVALRREGEEDFYYLP